MLEKEMYKPIEKLFIDLGFDVKAEVKDADISAVKGDDLVIIEMKTSLNMKLLYQALQRQRLTDFVYIAIPKPNYKTYKSKNFKEKLHIVRRLQIGLILVNDIATIEFDPKPFDVKVSRSRANRKKELHLKEFSSRFGNTNIGGVTKTKIMTAYRQQTLLIASELFEEKSTKELKSIYGFSKTSSILQKNYYKWFDRVSRGVYKLSEKGRLEIQEYEDYIKELKQSKEKGA